MESAVLLQDAKSNSISVQRLLELNTTNGNKVDVF